MSCVIGAHGLGCVNKRVLSPVDHCVGCFAVLCAVIEAYGVDSVYVVSSASDWVVTGAPNALDSASDCYDSSVWA